MIPHRPLICPDNSFLLERFDNMERGIVCQDLLSISQEQIELSAFLFRERGRHFGTGGGWRTCASSDFGWISLTADHNGFAFNLRPPLLLNRRKEGVHVDVQNSPVHGPAHCLRQLLSLNDEDHKREEVKHRQDDACKASFVNEAIAEVPIFPVGRDDKMLKSPNQAPPRLDSATNHPGLSDRYECRF